MKRVLTHGIGKNRRYDRDELQVSAGRPAVGTGADRSVVEPMPSDMEQ